MIFVRGKLSKNQYKNSKYLFEDDFDTAKRYNHDGTIDTLRHERLLKGFYFKQPLSSKNIAIREHVALKLVYKLGNESLSFKSETTQRTFTHNISQPLWRVSGVYHTILRVYE